MQYKIPGTRVFYSDVSDGSIVLMSSAL